MTDQEPISEIEKDFIKIIGHEPTLESVIEAIKVALNYERKAGNVTFLLWLNFSIEPRRILALKILESWKNGIGFDNQKDETKRQLYSLICTK